MRTIDPKTIEERKNNAQLNVLSILYFVFGGLSLFGAFILFIYNILVRFIFSKVSQIARPDDADQVQVVGSIFGTIETILLVVFIIALVTGILQLMSGFRMRKLIDRKLSIVAAIFSLFSFPLGTALGIFTLVVLSRLSVVEMYREKAEEIDEERFGMGKY